MFTLVTATSTGEQEEINNLHQGACLYKNMKLTVKICCETTTSKKSGGCIIIVNEFWLHFLALGCKFMSCLSFCLRFVEHACAWSLLQHPILHEIFSITPIWILYLVQKFSTSHSFFFFFFFCWKNLHNDTFLNRLLYVLRKIFKIEHLVRPSCRTHHAGQILWIHQTAHNVSF